MKTVQIKADEFFEMLKLHGVSMWELFEMMIDGEEKQLFFTNEDNEIIAEYILPKTNKELSKDEQTFKDSLIDQLSGNQKD